MRDFARIIPKGRAGGNKYIGTSSGFSLIHHTFDYAKEIGMQHQHMQSINTISPLYPDEDLINYEAEYPLPNAEDATLLIDAFVNSAFPLARIVHGPTFQAKIREWRSGAFVASSQFITLYRLALSIGAELLGKSDLSLEMFKNAYQLLKKDYWSNCDLETVQALTLIALYLQNNGRGNLAYLTLGIAIRQAYAIGLHRSTKLNSFDSNRIVAECRKRTFWCLFFMDKHSSMLLGRPSSIQDDDVDVELPMNIPDECITNQGILKPSISHTMNAYGQLQFADFSLAIEFGKICGNIYKRLYSLIIYLVLQGEL